MSQFNELLEQLKSAEEEQDTLAKSLPAAGGEEFEDATINAEGDLANEEINPEDEETSLTKSIKVGEEEFDIVDAEELIKSLAGLTDRVSEQEDVLAKGLSSALKLIQGQGELIKSLQTQMKVLGNQGAGRKAAVSLHERASAIESPLAKSDAAQPSKAEFLAKSEAAWKEGKLSGVEFNSIDVALRMGQAPDAALINKVLN